MSRLALIGLALIALGLAASAAIFVAAWRAHESPADPTEDRWRLREGRRDGYVSDGDGPDVNSMSSEEWEAAEQRWLDELGCTYDQLADMAAKGSFATVDHRVAWVMFKRPEVEQ